MRHLAITFFAVTAFAMGCKPSSEQHRNTTAEQFEKTQTKTRDAAQDMKDYTFAHKDAFVAKMQAQMAEIHQDLDQLMARVETSSNAAKAEAKRKLEALRDQAATLSPTLDEAKTATESTWDGVKAASMNGYGDLKEGFNQARQWVSDKIAP